MQNFKMTDVMTKVHSDIRGPLFEEALQMQKNGEKVLKLNTGNPASFGFRMPESVRTALIENVDKAVAYCDLKGMPEARRAIAEYEISKGIQGIDEDDVFIGNGVSEIAQMLMTCLLNPGDEFLLPSPSYSLWTNCAYIAGGTPVFYRCEEENAWQPSVEDIKNKITNKTKAILLINPNNPTGAIYGDDVLKEIASLAREHGLIVISDEIYDRLLLDGCTHTSFAKIAPDLPVITTNGLSKSHLICGFRCGWLVLSGDRKVTSIIAESLTKICAMRLCSNALTQLVIPAAMKDFKSTQSMMVPGGRIFDQREAVTSVLAETDGISFVKNRAAFYLFPKLDKKKFNITSDKQFALDLLHEKKILVIPGSGFDWNENDHFRIVMLPEKNEIRKAMLDLRDFLSTYKQK